MPFACLLHPYLQPFFEAAPAKVPHKHLHTMVPKTKPGIFSLAFDGHMTMAPAVFIRLDLVMVKATKTTLNTKGTASIVWIGAMMNATVVPIAKPSSGHLATRTMTTAVRYGSRIPEDTMTLEATTGATENQVPTTKTMMMKM